MNPPLVSVLIPAYRAERTIAATLDSVLAQTYPNVETIVVVDGSPDDTAAVARRYEAHGMRVIEQANAGASAARNRAFRESGGAFVQFLDADDLIAPDKIERQMARLTTEPEGTVSSGRWGWFDDGEDPAGATFQDDSLDWRDYDRPTDWLVDSWQHRKLMFPGVWLYPRAVVEAAGPWDERISLNDDGEYNTRVLAVARKIVFCSEARAYYRTGLPGSLSVRKDVAAIRSLFLSYVRSEANLFAADDSPAAQRAMARRWQEFAMEFYLRRALRPMVRYAEARARQLGGYRRPVSLESRIGYVERALGWKAAARAQALARRVGLQRPIRA